MFGPFQDRSRRTRNIVWRHYDAKKMVAPPREIQTIKLVAAYGGGDVVRGGGGRSVRSVLVGDGVSRCGHATTGVPPCARDRRRTIGVAGPSHWTYRP
jgi:hypothetical protein